MEIWWNWEMNVIFGPGHVLKNMNIFIVCSFAYELTMIWHIEVALVLKYYQAIVIHMLLFDDEDLMELTNECDIWLRSRAQEHEYINNLFICVWIDNVMTHWSCSCFEIFSCDDNPYGSVWWWRLGGIDKLMWYLAPVTCSRTWINQ